MAFKKMKFKKKDLSEAKYQVDKDDIGEFNDEMRGEIEDDDVVQVVDVNESEDEEVVEENVRPIITKKDLIRIIKENKNNE